MNVTKGDDAEYSSGLSGIKDQALELYSIIQDEHKRQVSRWDDEQACLETFVLALSSTRDLLKQEKARVHQNLSSLKAEFAKNQAVYTKGLDRIDIQSSSLDVVDLQKQLIELNNRLLAVNLELEDIGKLIGSNVRSEEAPLYETKLLVLQDTKRILQEEIDVLRDEIFRRESTAKYEKERKTAEASGWDDLTRLEEQLARLEVKIDRAKQLLYFPSVKGYRFTGGSAGVYTAAKDLYISEVSGRFLVTCHAVTKPDGTKVARVTIELTGATFGDLTGSRSTPPSASTVVGAAPPHSKSPFAAQQQPPRSNNGAIPAAHSPLTSSRRSTSDALPTPDLPAFIPSGEATVVRDPQLRPVKTAPSTTEELSEEQHMLAALGDSPSGSPVAARGTAYTPTEQLVQQISRGKQGKGAVVMGLLDGLNRRRQSRHSAEGSRPSSGSDMQEGAAGRSARRTTDGVPFEKRREQLRNLAHRAAETIKLDERKERLKTAASKTAQVMHLEERRGQLRNVASKTAQVIHLEDRKKQLLSVASKTREQVQRVGSRVSRGGSLRRTSTGEEQGDVYDHNEGYHDDEDVEGDEEVAVQVVQRRFTSDGDGDGTGQCVDDDDALLRPSPSATRTTSAVTSTPPAAKANLPSASEASPSTPAPATPEQAVNLPEASPAPSVERSPAPESLTTPTAARDPHKWSVGYSSPSPSATCTPPASTAPSITSPDISMLLEVGGTGNMLQSAQSNADTLPHGSSEARSGVRVMLLGEGVEVYGERGSKVPKIVVQEVALEVEAVLSASFEFSPMLGWQAPDRVTFEVQRLERDVQGNNIPLPRTLIKTVLNMVLPKVLTKICLTLLPVELGMYAVSTDQHVHLAGEFRVLGPPLTAFTADLTTPTDIPPPPPPTASTSFRTKHAKLVEAVQIAEAARKLLNLGQDQAVALAELFSGPQSLLEAPRALTIVELCRFYLQYSGSASWQPLCNMWNRALQMVLERRGVAERFAFLPFMEQQVATMVGKPARVALVVERLDMQVDVDGAAAAVRDYLERAAKDLRQNPDGKKEVVFRQPLEEQLAALAAWHRTFQEDLDAFKAKFKSASCSVAASADREQFQVGVQDVHYEGPCSLQVPMPGQLDPQGGFTLELKLPDPEAAMTTVVGRLAKVLRKLGTASVAASLKDSDAAALRLAGVSYEAVEALKQLPPDMQQVVQNWHSRLSDAHGSPLARHFKEIFDGPLLSDSHVGSASIHRLAVSLQLDQDQLAAALQEALQTTTDPTHLASMLAGRGHLFITGVAPGPKGDSAGAPSEEEEECMWGHVYSGQLSRARVDVQRALFRSRVSPVVAAKLLHAVLVGLVYQFHTADGKRLAALEAFFGHVKELLSKDTLRAFLAMSASGQVVRDQLHVRVCEAATSTREGAQGEGTGDGPCYPLYVVNDINLMAIFEGAKSVMDV